MLNNLNKSISISANSMIGENDNQNIVMYMNASINSNGDININQSIRNRNLYGEYQDTVEKDFSLFKDAVMDCAKDIS